MKDGRNIGGVAAIILGLTMLTGGTSSADQTASPPGSTPQPPRPLSELSAEWWQWIYSIPQPYRISATGASYKNEQPFNPLFDTSGANCMAGQRGSVWFLAGTNGAIGPVTRSCSVPEGASLFFPVIAFSNINTPGCPSTQGRQTVEQLQAAFPPVIESVNSNPLFVTVDSADVTKTLLKLVQSGPFALAFPAQNAFGPAACNLSSPPPNDPLRAGLYWPVVAEGYFVWLPPLRPGAHAISFTAASAATNVFGPNVQNVTYQITVCARSLSNACP